MVAVLAILSMKHPLLIVTLSPVSRWPEHQEPRGRSEADEGDVSLCRCQQLATWFNYPSSWCSQHDILIMKLTAAKKMDEERSPGMTNRPRPGPQQQHASSARDDSMTVLTWGLHQATLLSLMYATFTIYATSFEMVNAVNCPLRSSCQSQDFCCKIIYRDDLWKL